jgi:hypothetical protein
MKESNYRNHLSKDDTNKGQKKDLTLKSLIFLLLSKYLQISRLQVQGGTLAKYV